MTQKIWRLIGSIVGIALATTLASAANHEMFYKGKTLRLIVGAPAGGGFDTYSRALARHMAKHIPGAPTIVVENMSGAGTLVAANYTYRVAKPDGLSIGNFIGGLIIGQILGQPGIEFDARRFEWVGVPSKDNIACAFTKASGITSVEKWMAAKTPVKIGSTGRGTAPEDSPKVLKAALSLPVHLVSGYKGTADIRLAAESGELAGGCWQWESIKVTWQRGIEKGDVVVVLQVTPKPLPDLPGVPLALSFAKTEEARRLIQIGIQDQGAITRLYALPPGTPKERTQILRKAFMDTLKDPDFVADAKKGRLDIDPTPGEELERIVNDLFGLDTNLLTRLKEVLK
ncbi:MAG: Bug family tripartite tricarboxylate transporter substrate binding protein [Candidatus Binatia bacterium]